MSDTNTATNSANAISELEALKAENAELKSQLQNAEVRLREMGISDPITGLYSYRYLLGRLTEEVSRADRFKEKVSCIMIGLDKNSFEGLLQVSKLLKDSSRQYDIPARWSQNELVMLLPCTPMEGAKIVAERFCAHVKNTLSEYDLTVSVGVASYPYGDSIEDARMLVEAADAALHLAMDNGGNCVQIRS
jgi:diguanylate cyclase (GGDEF)-like protein